MSTITREIINNFGVIGTRRKQLPQLRMVSWNGNQAKYDIRGWYTDYKGEEACTKGISLTEEELKEVYEVISKIDLGDKEQKVFACIPQNGRSEIQIALNKYGYDISICTGNYRLKGVTFSATELETFRNLLAGLFGGKQKAAPTKAPAMKAKQPDPAVIKDMEMDSTVRALTTIPVNDGNYPLKTATADQLRAAIAIMESKPEGNKTRLTRCKAKLKTLEKSPAPETKEVVQETVQEVAQEVKPDPVITPVNNPADKAEEKPTTKKAEIIQFPKRDTTQIVRLKPTGEGHTLAEAEEKLGKELEKFKGDTDSQFVIKGVLDACKEDQELLDNVMRPEKSYTGAMQYFFAKAKEGYCTRIGNVGIMSASTALKYAIDYFNSDESAKTKKPEKEAKANAPVKTAKAPAKVTPVKRSRRRTTKRTRR